MYFPSEFFGGIVKNEILLHEIGRKDYAQYKDALYVTYTPKGKRTSYIKRLTYSPYVLILKGWNHPEPEEVMVKVSEGNGMTVSESRYATHDERFRTDFDMLIENYKLQPDQIILDVRNTVQTEIVNELCIKES